MGISADIWFDSGSDWRANGLLECWPNYQPEYRNNWRADFWAECWADFWAKWRAA